MNTGQMMLIIFAFALLSTLALSINAMMFGSLTLGMESEAAINAHALAQSMIDEILTREYDEKALTTKIYDASGFTTYAMFGPEVAPTIEPSFRGLNPPDTTYASKKYYDDVDDYQGYKRIVTNSRFGQFMITDTIRYVSETDPNVVTNVRSHYKRVTVYVTNPNMGKNNSGAVIPVLMRDLAVYRRYF